MKIIKKIFGILWIPLAIIGGVLSVIFKKSHEYKVDEVSKRVTDTSRNSDALNREIIRTEDYDRSSPGSN